MCSLTHRKEAAVTGFLDTPVGRLRVPDALDQYTPDGLCISAKDQNDIHLLPYVRLPGSTEMEAVSKLIFTRDTFDSFARVVAELREKFLGE
jgi:hypothetical protein